MDSAPLLFVQSYICLFIFYSLTFNFCLSSLFVFYSNQLRLVPTLLCVLPLVEVRTATFRFLRLFFCVFLCASKDWFTSAEIHAYCFVPFLFRFTSVMFDSFVYAHILCCPPLMAFATFIQTQTKIHIHIFYLICICKGLVWYYAQMPLLLTRKIVKYTLSLKCAK